MDYMLFSDYYSKLIGTLPASDLSHYFVSEKIISLADHDDIIRSLTPRQAAKLLLDQVLVQLQNCNNAVFNKMLVIMDHHGVSAAKAIALEIRSKLSALKHEQGKDATT